MRFIHFLLLSFFFFLQNVSLVTAQGTLVADYRIDNCSADDFLGNNDGFILGTPCACGVRADGFRFNGSQSVSFSPSINSVIGGDFSISFYAKFDESDQRNMDVFSLAETCVTDSVLLIRYIPEFNTLRILMSSSPDNRFTLNAEITSPDCWNYIVFTKEGAGGKVYVNEVEMDSRASISDLNLKNDANFALGGSPCVGTQTFSDQRFTGDIDEIRIYEGALTERQIREQNYRPDQILTPDTTIFAGESVLIETGGTCSDDFEWSPADGLSSTTDLNPVAQPTEPTSIYTLTITDGSCVVTDDIQINVVDREVVTCADLVLPNAFTPNGDNINDTYGISNEFLVDELISFEIFNRTGGRVFGTRDLAIKWNGQHNNADCAVTDGPFVYRVLYKCQGTEYKKTGTVSLLR